MKSRPKLKSHLEISISVAFIVFHLSFGHVSSSAGDPNETIGQKLFGVMNSTDLRNYHKRDLRGVTSPGYTQVPLLTVGDEVDVSRRLRRHSSSKRRHRLLLRSGDLLRAPSGGRKGRRHRKNFVLKSDGEGHIITSANQVHRDWCRTVPFTLNVTVPRCRTREVKNNFCYGQCNSFFIPQQSTSQGVAFQSYSNCKPDQIRWTNVTLDCPGQNPPLISKTVLFVESCRCTAAQDARHLRHRSARRG